MSEDSPGEEVELGTGNTGAYFSCEGRCRLSESMKMCRTPEERSVLI